MRRHTFLAAVAVAAGLSAGGGAAGAEGLAVVPTGPVETVFDWSRQACRKTHVPDAPARAFTDADGIVHLIASHNDNREFVGPTLDDLRPSCRVIYEGQGNADMAAFDDLSWISSVYTRDGNRIYALAHTEQRGNRTPGLCPAGKYSPCLLNTVTALVSTNGGSTFQKAGGGPAVVATLPYAFPTDRNARVGYANPTNIIERDGWYYVFVFADAYRAQRRGPCLLRTRTLDDPSSWRAWDGSDFSISFSDPFRSAVADPSSHLCTPVASGMFSRMIGSVVKHRESGLVVAVFADERKLPDGRTVRGIFSATSRDLIRWSDPVLAMEADLLWKRDCNRQAAYFYPALLDPQATSLSFEDFGNRGYLYLVRYNLTNCKVNWDRDLVRVPVEIRSGS